MSENPDTQPDPELSHLVEKTEGLQPWRRLFHAGNGILIVVALQLLSIETRTVLVLLGSVLFLLLLMDAARLTNPKLNRLFFRAFSSFASPREAGKIASSSWYILGVILALLLFPKSIAAGGILVLALADPAASAVGRTWGTRPFGTGTVEGTATFVAVAFLVLLPFSPWWAALAAAVVTSFAELLPWRLDDNLVIPVTAAGVLFLTGL